MTHTITVSCLKSDQRSFGAQKYDNAEDWNVSGGRAPNGVSATRYLRQTNPDAYQLTPLAAWLVANLPAYVAGKQKRRTGNLRCEGRETTVIESWLFPQIAPSESDTEYWNRVARELLAAGVARVSIDSGPKCEVQS